MVSSFKKTILISTIISLGFYFNVYLPLMQNYKNRYFTICGNPQQRYCNLIPKYYPKNENVTCLENYVHGTYYVIGVVNLFDYCANKDFVVSRQQIDLNFIKNFGNKYVKIDKDKWIWSPSDNNKYYNGFLKNNYHIIINSILLLITLTFLNIVFDDDENFKLNLIFSMIPTIFIPSIINFFIDYGFNDSENFVNIGTVWEIIKYYEVPPFYHFFYIVFILILS